MKKIMVVFILPLLLGTFLLVNGYGEQADKDPPPKPKKPESKVAEMMRRKLVNAQQVLEGLATKDFAEIDKHAGDLLRLSQQAEWKVLPSPEYLVHSNEFQRAAESLIKTARDKNLDGAALAYVEMTLTCVRCHKYVREVRMTRLDIDRVPSLRPSVKSTDIPRFLTAKAEGKGD